MPHSNTENYPVVIFLPLYELYEDGYLYGEVNTDPLLQTTNFFIHEATGNALRPNNLHSIGFIGDAHLSNNMISKKKNWLHLKFDNKTPYVVKLINYHLEIKEMDYQIILYDKYRFLKSELLLSDSDIESGDDNIIDDHFKRLTYSLQHLEVLSKTKDDFPTVIKLVFTTFLFCLKILDNALSWSPTLLKYSSLVNHAAMFVKSMIWGLEITMQKKKLKSLKTGNYISSVIGDWISGLLLLFWLLSVITIKDMLQTLAEHSEAGPLK